MTEETRNSAASEQIDYTKPPKGYEVVGTGGTGWAKRPRPARWSVRLNGDHIRFESTKRNAIAAAWALERDRLSVVRLLQAVTSRCPTCQVRIVDAGGEAPTALYVDAEGRVVDENGTWVCSDCIDSGRWPAGVAGG